MRFRLRSKQCCHGQSDTTDRQTRWQRWWTTGAGVESDLEFSILWNGVDTKSRILDQELNLNFIPLMYRLTIIF